MSLPYRAGEPGRLAALPHARPSSPPPPALPPLAFRSGVAAGATFLAVTALFLFVVVPDLPSFRAPAATRAAYYAAMSRSLVYRATSYLAAVQLLLLLPFFGGLLGVLRREEGGDGTGAFTVFGAGVALALVAPIAILVEDHLLLGFAARGVDPAVVVAVDGLVPVSFALAAMPQAIVVGGAALLLRRRCAIPRWLGWSGLAVAVLSLAGTATLVRGAFFPVSHLANLLARVWLLALAVALRPRAAGQSTPGQPSFEAA